MISLGLILGKDACLLILVLNSVSNIYYQTDWISNLARCNSTVTNNSRSVFLAITKKLSQFLICLLCEYLSFKLCFFQLQLIHIILDLYIHIRVGEFVKSGIISSWENKFIFTSINLILTIKNYIRIPHFKWCTCLIDSIFKILICILIKHLKL